MSKAEEVKAGRVDQLMNDMNYKFVYFKGGNLMSGPGTNGFIPFNSRKFGALVQQQKAGTSENMTGDFAKTIKTISPDWSHNDDVIAFKDQLWDMRTLEFDADRIEYVYSTQVTPHADTAAPWKFLCELACGDEELARDYLQAMAPLFMYRKPAGVIWFVGDGANGKSSLISAIYRIVGDKHLSSLTTASIEDGKAAPVLMGVLGNIVREASENRVEDSERYKAIGTHEPFAIRQLYSHDNITVETNFHTIFNANNVPVFGDKTKGARRRTLVVPFKAHFQDNPTFDDDTFTPEFLGGLLTLILEETRVIRDNHYRYKWSDATVQAKAAYDSEVNSAEAYVDFMLESKIAGFYNYAVLKSNYDLWCGQSGLIPLGMTSLKRVIVQQTNADRRAMRVDGKPVQRFQFESHYKSDLVWLENGYGMPSANEKKLPQATNGVLSGEW